MTFTTTKLLDGGVLVEGIDAKGNEGTTVLRSERWQFVQHLRTHKVAEAQFDAAVKEFFAPLTDAADAAKAALLEPGDNFRTVTIEEGVEGTPAHTVELDEDGILLRLLDEGQHDKLRWVGDNQLVALQ